VSVVKSLDRDQTKCCNGRGMHFDRLQGSHASLKVFEFFPPKFKASNVLENRTCAWKSLNFMPQVLESPGIHQVRLRDISNFVKQVFA